MSNRERTGQRDLAVSGWHRRAFGDNATAIDLDLMGLCKKCGAHLYVLEDTRELGAKPTTITKASANRLNCVAFLIQYRRDELLSEEFEVFRATRIWPEPRTVVGGEDELARLIQTIRDQHDLTWHGRAW